MTETTDRLRKMKLRKVRERRSEETHISKGCKCVDRRKNKYGITGERILHRERERGKHKQYRWREKSMGDREKRAAAGKAKERKIKGY